MILWPLTWDENERIIDWQTEQVNVYVPTHVKSILNVGIISGLR